MARKRSLGLWYRFYVSVLDNPKIEALSDFNFRIWTKLNAIATSNGGLIPGDMGTLAILCRRSEGKIRNAVQVLLSAKLMEYCDQDLTPHEWELWQYDSDISTNRVKAFRERTKTKKETLHETPLERNETPDETLQHYVDTQSTEVQRTETRDDDARGLLNRVCEILRVRLEDDPDRVTWLRQVQEMRRDSIPDVDIIHATEIARTRGVLSLSYIRTAALNLAKSAIVTQLTQNATGPPVDAVGERLKAKWAAEEKDEQAGRLRANS